MTRRTQKLFVWFGALGLVLLLASRAGAAPIYSLSLSDGTKSDGADLFSLSSGKFSEFADSITKQLIQDATQHLGFDWAVFTEYDGGSALSPGKKVGEHLFTGFQFTGYDVIGGTLGGVLGGLLGGGNSYTYGFIAKSYQFNPPTQQTPEPATLALIGMGLGGLALARRRKSPAN